MDLQVRITNNPAVRFGKPCVRGTRLTVGDVLLCLAYAADRERCLFTLSSSAA